MSRGLIGTLIGVAFVGIVVYAAMGELQAGCEVCMRYRGQQICERARAADQDQAIMQATTSACARLSNGVTDGIQCNNTPPVSTTCEG